MTFNWCHGPSCHKRKTTTRVRGVKGSKVLRTMKINVSGMYPQGVYKYFCDQTCMHDFFRKHYLEFIRLHPRTECLETPLLNPTKQIHGTGGYVWSTTKIELDESRNTG